MRCVIKDRIDEIVGSLWGERVDFNVLPSKDFGDYAVNVAFLLAKKLKRSPQSIAEEIAKAFPLEGGISKVEALRGYVNIHLSKDALMRVLKEAVESPSGFARSGMGRGRRILVEFVSANPTGPLNVVNARAAAFGDSLVRMMRHCGFDACSEFYVNDGGRQVEMLGLSCEARWRQLVGESAELPKDGYFGDYVIDFARKLMDEGVLNGLSFEDRVRVCRERMVEWVISHQKEVLERFRVQFNTWVRESEILNRGLVEQTLELLKERGVIYEREGALWFASSHFGDDKDRPIVKSNGDYTYLAPDAAYHRDKFVRGFEHLIDIWGPDHQGYISRMRAIIEAMGYPPSAFEVIIVQQVSLTEDGVKIKMSKRAGEFITMEDLLDKVGVDPARFFFLLRKASSHLDFDINVALQQTEDNPVYYVQYAHARMANIIRVAEERGVEIMPPEEVDASVLTAPLELALLRKIYLFREFLEDAVLAREPHRIPYYLHETASLFHNFYQEHRVVGSGEYEQARLLLVRGLKTLFAVGLSLIGVSAPERM